MGSFSNGTEGEIYQEEYCYKCIHEDGCPIWDLHFLWVGDAISARNIEYAEEHHRLFVKQEMKKHSPEFIKKMVLDEFIPREGIENLECKMFVEKGKVLKQREDGTSYYSFTAEKK